MKKLIQMMLAGALFAAVAAGARGEESRRGFYEGSLAGGGRVVFFVQAKESISTYLFDTAGRQASFAGGPVATGSFSLTTSANQTISGSIGTNSVTASFLGQTITAPRAAVFGNSEHFSGRFTTTARSDSGASLDLKIVIDSQNNIFLVTKQGSTVLGGFGTLTVQPSASPSPTPSPTPSPSPSGPQLDRENEPGDDHGGTGRHGSEGDDDAEDRFEDRNAGSFDATFTVNFVTGQVVTGRLTFSHGTLLGDLILNGVTYSFRAPQQSSANHLANISTRGFVNGGQGQLIGGFIITGGPKLVIVRALGPSLADRGVTPALADPTIQLFNGSTLLRENDNWQSAANANELIASDVAPEKAKEAAIMIRLEPGAYTTVVSGVSGGTGIGLVEVYEITHD